ncbi:flagellar hook-basal body complex protein FliE [Piscibacillus sp. B03]|uniref:flagellar hook-basal body complex protein FliE n=1 Tax=Piscibacillus sp. B03 TaxID=3457430 RepID=UPI003FCCEA0F
MEPINSTFLKTDMNNLHNIKSNQPTPSEAQSRFSSALKNAINEVNDLQAVSDQKTNGLVTGEVKDLHEVMIASQKASVSLQTATQLQSKAIDAYKEIMRMQI